MFNVITMFRVSSKDNILLNLISGILHVKKYEEKKGVGVIIQEKALLALFIVA